jgi:hypothetical protein
MVKNLHKYKTASELLYFIICTLKVFLAHPKLYFLFLERKENISQPSKVKNGIPYILICDVITTHFKILFCVINLLIVSLANKK